MKFHEYYAPLEADEAELKTWCTLFLQSTYYRRAMSDARYERMIAIRDFLRAQASLQPTILDKAALEEWALAIRKNYYRYF